MDTKKKNGKKAAVAVAALLAVVIVLLAVYHFTRPQTAKGEKQVTIEVVHKDGSVKTFDCQTDAEYLGEILKAEKIVEGEDGPYGLFITAADGETADENNQEWWCITKGGEQVNTSADQAPVADKDQFELTLTVGY